MSPIKLTPSTKPKCPNHGEPLEGCGFPLPAKGTGRCPVSGASFDFEVDQTGTAVRRDKFGNPMIEPGWKITGDDKP